MPTEADYVKFFEWYNPSGGGAEEWNMWCQAFVARASVAGGGWVRTYETAKDAMEASGWLNPDWTIMPLGAVGFWDWDTDGHTAFHIGNGFWMMGSRHVDFLIGGVARNAGTIHHTRFQELGLNFRGWAPTNGGNVIPVSFPPAPELPKPSKTQRQVRSDYGVNIRTSPSTGPSAVVIGSLPANAIVNIGGFVTDGGMANGTTVWYELATGGWMNANSFTELHGHDLPDKTIKPVPPVVVPPVVVPPVVVPPVVVPPVVVPPVEVEVPVTVPPVVDPEPTPEPEPEPEAPARASTPGGLIGAIIVGFLALGAAIAALWPW